VDDSVVRVQLAANELVWSEDWLDGLDVRIAVQRELHQHPFVAKCSQDYSLGAGHMKRLKACIGYSGKEAVRSLGRRFAL